MLSLFGLADCNNFYCSCERVFRPDLQGKPVVVLSNNDGCVIARSEEAKALGLKMGEPFFKVRPLLEEHGVAVFSSNYTLYGSLSSRVMNLLSAYTPQLDIYSIDEAFLDFTGMDQHNDMKTYGEQLVRHVTQSTGIPISLGIAPTKTLAKIGSKFAKKYKGYHGCCIIDTEDKRLKALTLTDVTDVWGIGRRIGKLLEYYGIHTAADFAAKKESWVRAKFSVTTLRTWKELNGISCISIEQLPHKQTICTSRSFADKGITDHNILEEAVANFASRCAAKLRQQHCHCQGVSVFAHTSPFRPEAPQHTIYQTTTLTVATNDTAEIIAAAIRLLRNAYQPGSYAYKKAGVIIWNIMPSKAIQQHLFDPIDRTRQAALVKAIDEINRKNGHVTVRLAIQGTDKRFQLKKEYESLQYTTNINHIIVAKTEKTK
ncbi:MAG: Y-family DNA polymerase [Prevotella sp.]|nr:Y-family DNA polymerase [Prevotella sp.]